MKIKERAMALLLCALLLLPAASRGEGAIAITLKKGGYITLGSYMGEPIIWRCVGEDENGMLLISRDILCYKAFSSGTGRWDKSFLRTWLNSAGPVFYEGDAPDASHTDSNAYNMENGFLTGFSAEELALVKTVTNRSVVNQTEAASAQTGEGIHVYNSSGLLADTIQNYSDAFAVFSEDRVFCPNIDQMATMASFYPSEVIAEPTEGAVLQSGNAKNRETRSNNYYWLRDGLGNVEFPNVARCVFPNGRVLFSDVVDGSIGVRPAIYLDLNQTAYSGGGYEASPYVIAAPGQSAGVAQGSSDAGQRRETAQGALSSITEGDYLIMGKFNGADILWRCVDITANGPLMLSDRILTFCAFDAAGGEHQNSVRNAQGGNSWKNSTLRHWLNSSEGEGDKLWPLGNPPSSEATGGSNGYSRKAGFLTGFSPEELSYMRPASVKSVINVLDIDETTVGSEVVAMRRNIENASSGPEAYSGYTYDTVFLLSIDEAKNVKDSFGEDVLAVPTPEALNLNEANIANQASDMTASWWLRDGDGQAVDPQGVRILTQDGWVDRDEAFSPGIGVRPGFYLNMDTVNTISGNGSYDEPFRVSTHSYGEWFTEKEPTCTERGIRRRICAICGLADDEPIAALGHSFAKAKRSHEGLYTVTERTCERCGETHTRKTFGPAALAAGFLALLAAVAFALRGKKKK